MLKCYTSLPSVNALVHTNRVAQHLNRRIAALAVPALGSIAAEPLYNIADTAIVGHLGRVPLDSLAIAASALAIVAWVAIFLSTATISAVARLKAAGHDAAAGRSVGAAYLVAVAWGVATAVIVVIAAPWAATLLGARGDVLDGATGYLRASAGRDCRSCTSPTRATGT